MTDDELHARMTKRQREYALLLTSGCTTDADIARAMHISPETVRKYINRLFDLTGMSTRLELALFIVRRPRLEQLLQNGPEYKRGRR